MRSSFFDTFFLGIGTNHRWRIRANKVRVSNPSGCSASNCVVGNAAAQLAAKTSYRVLSAPTLTPASNIGSGGTTVLVLSTSEYLSEESEHRVYGKHCS